MKTFHHLDHMFGSLYFLNKMKKFKVSSLDEAILSDHAALLLELDI
jgi:endonuclease/exonuclease/phosphatase family metal-dependent hydrolase